MFLDKSTKREKNWVSVVLDCQRPENKLIGHFLGLVIIVHTFLPSVVEVAAEHFQTVVAD